MLPVVGVTPLWDEEKQSLWMLPGYLNGLRQAGCLPMILPLTKGPKEIDQMLTMVDGILLTGGQDVSPELYGETPAGTGEICEMRDAMEGQLLKKAMVLEKSVLGICRGIQFINAALGGSLYQDIPREHPSAVEHHQSPPYDKPSHEVTLMQGGPLRSLLGQEKLCVNSYHHQAIKRLADGLEVMARSDDNLVEAVWKPDQRFLWAVQWHPECSFRTDEASRRIFAAFAGSMKQDGLGNNEIIEHFLNGFAGLSR